MNLIDRLIAKAQTIQLNYSDNIIIIRRGTGSWMVDGQTFPDLEAAQEYVERLVSDNADCTVIINDVAPSLMLEPGKVQRKRRKRWIAEYKAEKTKAENPLPPMPKKDRNLI